MPYKFNESRRHKIPVARYRVTNWPEYDAALVRRGSLTVWITEEAIAAGQAPATGKRGGQPIYSAIAIETSLALRLVFHQPLRQTEGLLRSIADVLEIDIAVPDHTTLSRRGGGLTILPKRIDRAEPLHLLVDSTGLKIYGEGEWLDQKRGIRPRRRWRKLHLGVDADTHEIVAVELTPDDVGDISELPGLLDQIDTEIASLTADGAYDGEVDYRAAANRHPDAEIIPPRATAVPNETTTTQRDRHIATIEKHGCMGWQRRSGYNRRSLVETAVYSYKTIIGRRLQARTLSKQRTEAKIGCNVLNRMTRFRHAALRSDPLMLDPMDRCRRRPIHAPKRSAACSTKQRRSPRFWTVSRRTPHDPAGQRRDPLHGLGRRAAAQCLGRALQREQGGRDRPCADRRGVADRHRGAGERGVSGPDRDRHDPADVRGRTRPRHARQDRPAQSVAVRRRARGDHPGSAVPRQRRRVLRQRPSPAGVRRTLGDVTARTQSVEIEGRSAAPA